MKQRFNRLEVDGAVHRLKTVMASGKTMGEALAAAKNPYEDASLRMAFSLGLNLKKQGKTLAAVESVDFERLDEHRHAIEINWVQMKRRIGRPRR
jgi:hypothetical protein